MKKFFKRTLMVLVVVFVLMQFANPSLTNPPVVPGQDVWATNAPPQRVAAMLRASCYDCHSNETEWPWYSHVSPVSWWLVDHIKDGRRHLNFSEWPHDNPRRARSHWQNIRDEVEGGTMPLKSYTLIHRAAILSASDAKELAEWADQEAQRIGKERMSE